MPNYDSSSTDLYAQRKFTQFMGRTSQKNESSDFISKIMAF